MRISEAARREIECFDLDLPVEMGLMPPAGWYGSQEIFDLEREAVFGRTWQPVARREQVPEPGRYISGCLAGRPWVITRDLEGHLRAFYNVCRHKGREVVLGAGKAEQLVCGYHAWSYDLNGRLRKAPQMAGAKAFERETMGLRPMRVEAWGPWICINPDMDAAPLGPRLLELNARLDATDWGKLKYAERREWTLACNWKVYVDNYLDGGYHVPHMHPSLSAQLDMSGYQTELFGEYSIQSSKSARQGDISPGIDAQKRIGKEAIYAWIYPNLMLNRYGPCLDMNHVIPLSPSSCKVVYEFYFLECEGESGRAFMAESMEQSAVIQREDIEICESVQRGLSSGAYERGRYAPRVEHGEHHFHGLLARALRQAMG